MKAGTWSVGWTPQGWWVRLGSGDLFGPYASHDEATAAVPAIRAATITTPQPRGASS